MRNKLLYLVLPFFMLSCNEWLNVEPEDEISEEKLFSTGTGFRHALNGVYFTMESRNLYGKHLTWGIVDALGQVYDYKKAPGVNEMQYGAAKYGTIMNSNRCYLLSGRRLIMSWPIVII